MQAKKDFPFFEYHPDLIYLDNAATTHKPRMVINAITKFYERQYATAGRSMYHLAEQATQRIDDVRSAIADFIHVQKDEIVFTKGSTDGINFIASSWAERHLKSGDEIVLTHMEHHSNLLPWQRVAKRTGAQLRFISVTDQGTLDLSTLDSIITSKTKLVACVLVSNALGTTNDVSAIVAQAHEVGAKVLLDASQAMGHQDVDVTSLNPDFMVFSGHKMYGPTGIGVLYINKNIQPEVEPYQLGGGTIFEATYEQATLRGAPYCYEAGTLPIAQIIGLGAAIDYLNQYDVHEIHHYESSLNALLIDELSSIGAIKILGPIEQLKKVGHLITFTMNGFHPHDVAAYLDHNHIAVRAGHFCAQPLARKLGIESSVRVSFGLYNTQDDVKAVSAVLRELKNPI